MSWEQWRGLDEFQRVCWYWVYKNRQLEQMFGDTSYYMRIRFEDLFLGENKQAVLKDVIAFMGMPYDDRFIRVYEHKRNISRKTYFPQWPEWSPERQQQLLDICGSQMARYGYSVSEEVN